MKLTGQVTVNGDEPADSAVVEIHNSQGDVLDQVQVDTEGRFTYHLTAGKWTLNVWDAKGHRGKCSITLEDKDKTCDVILEDAKGAVS